MYKRFFCCIMKELHYVSLFFQLSDSLIKEESTLATVSEQCKAEIDHYKKERVHTLCYSVAAFAESQLAIAKQIEQSLRVSLMKLKES